jgi:predicted regulator of Ras-like GTPase activity (Roadblock/LC7/MglB family)
MLSTSAQLKKIVADLKSSNMVDAAAVVRRDGILMASNFPHYSVGSEVFAMMSATVLGAAKNITLKSNMGIPTKVTVDTKEGSIIVAGAGTKALLVCLIKGEKDSAALSVAVENAVEKVNDLL